ncbi:putative TLC domain-containing protein C17A2.02c [Cladobotryum mycophilum]|uniref:TLC domain-containing protein C17A2.02c n=1 Tax=Cladobotryum mycophilum TaxID=491253 RepID=A0ABR0S6G0_9HYPO
MKDPFPIPPIPWLSDLVQPFADRYDMPTLPLHIHEVLFAALFYSFIFWPISPLLSKLIAPQHYSQLNRKKRLNWDAHIVSFIQSTLINILAIWVMLVDEERKHMDWEGRVWGYTGAAAMIQALAAGYFVWDLFVTSFNLDVFGLGTLAHAVAALLVYSLGFRPLVNYYSSIFILWELSTPFLNIHWFMDKVNMTGSKAQLYNGILLLSSFFSCRLVYGTYQSFSVLQDLLRAVNNHPTKTYADTATMAFTTSKSTVQPWIAGSYLISNLTLNFLNFYWFIMMIRAVRKRFEPGSKAEPVTEVEIDLSSVASGASRGPQPQRRKA